MSIVKKQQVYADTPTYVSNHAGCTFGDIFENCVTPVLKEIFGTAVYKVNTQGYPCVLIPGTDGQISSYTPCITFLKKATDSTASSAAQIRLGCFNATTLDSKDISVSYQEYHSGGSTGNGALSLTLSNKGIMFNAFDIDDYGYQFGIYPSSGENVFLGSMPCRILKGKDALTEAKTDVIISECYGNISSMSLVYYKPSTDSIISTSIQRWVLPEQSTCANLYEFNDGNIVVDNFYICFPLYQKILMPFVAMSVNITPTDLWSNPVTINGTKFSLAIPGGTGSTGASSMTIAKKLE